MTAFSNNAHYTTDTHYGKGQGGWKHARVFSLISLIVIFTFIPPWAARPGQDAPSQTQGYAVLGGNHGRSFRAGQDAIKRKGSLVKESASRAAASPLDETRWIHSVSVPNLFSYDIVQQPESDPYYVSPSSNLITEFGLAKQYGTIGLIAHNNLAGSLFKDLNLGQEVYIVHESRHTDRYIVSAIYRFQALESTNPESHFVNLDSGEILTASEVFNQMYTGTPHLTFQTCINARGDASWGRLFVIAVPAS